MDPLTVRGKRYSVVCFGMGQRAAPLSGMSAPAGLLTSVKYLLAQTPGECIHNPHLKHTPRVRLS